MTQKVDKEFPVGGGVVNINSDDAESCTVYSHHHFIVNVSLLGSSQVGDGVYGNDVFVFAGYRFQHET